MNDRAGAHAYWWQGDGGDRPRGAGWTPVGAHGFLRPEHHFTARHLLPAPVPDWAEDLFRVARAAYLADRHSRRDVGPDRWTRCIRLSVPVAAPDAWRAPAAHGALTTLLETLTSDTWELQFHGLRTRMVPDGSPGGERAGEVALFSGGLDSLSWAAQRTQADPRHRILLVTFEDHRLMDVQRAAYTAVAHLLPERPPPLRLTFDHRIQPEQSAHPRRLESSARTLGLLYTAAALRAAAAHGTSTLHVPENGHLALGPPLTPARWAACSPRPVHPWALHHLNALVEAVGGAVRTVNPFRHLTKGEVCEAALRAGVPGQDLQARTLSCGRPPARRRGGEAANCGTCLPCLVRRAGLLHACGQDLTAYERTPWKADPYTARDWHALRRWLDTPYTYRELLADTPLPPDSDLPRLLSLIHRSHAELRGLTDHAARRFPAAPSTDPAA